MNPNDNLLENFSNMSDEFNSSNNRMLREIDEIFKNELNDFKMSLKMLNEEYELVSDKIIDEQSKIIGEKLMNLKITQVSSYVTKFKKELGNLKKQMCNFFNEKLSKGDSCKRKMSNEIKDSVDKLCDFGLLNLEEEISGEFYNFKVNFEMNFIRSEYSKDDFNKIIRSSKHCLTQKIRDCLINSINEKQEIVSRYATSGYEIVDSYHEKKR